MKAWVLMWYGVDESSCYGIVTERALAHEWEARSDGNSAVVFELNVMPPMKRWRDEKMIPYAPRTGPATNMAEHLSDYMSFVLSSQLLSLPHPSGKKIQFFR